MSTDITIRHVKISVALQTAADKKADRLVASYPAIENIHIVFDQEGEKIAVSLSIQGGQKTTVTAFSKDADAAVALSSAFEKASSQLRRASQKRQSVRK